MSRSIIQPTDEYLSDLSIPQLVAVYRAHADTSSADGRSKLRADEGDLKKATAAAWLAIERRNEPPRLFRRAGSPVRVEFDDNGSPKIMELTENRLRHETARAAVFLEYNSRKKEDIETRPPLDMVRDMLACPEMPLPPLDRVVEVPVFAPDGHLHDAPGYDPATRSFLRIDPELRIPPLPDEPTEADAFGALRTIGNVLADFPFVGRADRAHAVALLLLPFARNLIEGPTPNHEIEAPDAGTGKGLLAHALLSPGAGANVGYVSECVDDDEWRKAIHSMLMEGRPVICIDNVNRVLDSGSLALALTQPTVSGRILGVSKMADCPVRCVWVTTGNNISMSKEISRRTIRIRLDAKCDRPWERSGFRIENLTRWVSDNRGTLIHAALVLIRRWIVAGKPSPKCKPLGTYERWTHVIGGILEHAGIKGFLANASALYESADTTGAAWRRFVGAWWDTFRDEPTTTAQLMPVANAVDGFVISNAKTEKGQQTALGMALGKRKDTVIGSHQILEAGELHHVRLWKLANINQTTSRARCCKIASSVD